MRLFLVLFGICGLIGFVAVGGWPPPTHADRMYAGRIEMDALMLGPEPGGTLAELLAVEGQRVTTGEVLARLDTTGLEAARARAAGLLEAARAERDAASRAATLAASTWQLEVAMSRASVAEAGARASLVVEGPRREALARSRLRVEQAQARLAEASREVRRIEKLAEGGSAAPDRLDRAETEAGVRELDLGLARQELEEALSGSRSQEVSAAVAVLDRQSAALSRAIASELQVEEARARLSAAAKRVDAAAAELAAAEHRLRTAAVVAPRDGLIDEVLRRPGEVLRPGDHVLRLLDHRHPYLKVFLTRPAMARLSQGSAVRVLVPSSGRGIFEGRVARISREAEFTPKDVQTRERRATLVYEVKIALSDPGGELRAGEQADLLAEG